MSLKPIRNEDEYNKALNFSHHLNEANFDHQYDALIKMNDILIESYEKKQWPKSFDDPIQAIHFFCTEKGMTLHDLRKILGKNTEDILKKEKPLTKDMIWKLCWHWKIPADLLIQEYVLKTKINKMNHNLSLIEGE